MAAAVSGSLIGNRIIAAFLLNELDFVSVGVFDEGNDCSAMHHRTCFTNDFSAFFFNTFTRLVGVVDFNGNMSVGITQIILLRIPIVGQFQNRAVGFVAVTDEGKGKSAFGIVFSAEQFHAQNVLVKIEGFFEIAHAEHSME